MTGYQSKKGMARNKLEQWDTPSEAFNAWWNNDYDDSTNPFRLESGAYWAWAGWKAALAQPAQEPVAWAVQGCSKMWRGEFAEIDAKAEAKRIGGTCIAYALYTAPPQREWNAALDEAAARIGEIKGFGQATQDSFAVFIAGLKR
jgi:hypothetical protein